MYVFDAHCDYLYHRVKERPTGLTAEAVAAGKIKKSIFAVFEGHLAETALVKKQLEVFHHENLPVEQPYLAFEGLSWLNALKDAQIVIDSRPVYVGPMWNQANALGGSCREDGELTLFGECVLREIGDNGVLIDLAHAGERMFASCAEKLKNVIFTHGNVNHVHENIRNLKDWQIKKLIELDSFMGLTLYEEFVGGKSIEKLFEHIEAVLMAGGENILGFGSDIDGCDKLVGEKNDAGIFADIIEEMLRRNYAASLMEKLLHGNLEKCVMRCKKSFS